MNVLVVDDKELNRKLLRAVFEAEGMNVREACNGVEAVEVLKDQAIDAIVTDLMMPEMDGFNLMRQVRETPASKDIPVVAYSATYTSAYNEDVCLDFGADMFIRKPSQSKIIVNAVVELVNAKHSGNIERKEVDDKELYPKYYKVLSEKLEKKNRELERSQEVISAKYRISERQISELNAIIEKLEAQAKAMKK